MNNPQKTLPGALYFSVLIVIAIYVSVSLVVVGNLSLLNIVKAKDYALAEAAKPLFSMGGFLQSFGYHLGYKTLQVGDLMFLWGILGAASCFIGALIGDKMVKGKYKNDDIFYTRLNIMMIANVLVGVGALIIIFLGPRSFTWLVIGAIINTSSQILAPNYWASLSNIFPIALIGAGAFALGLLSNIPSAVGPLTSSFLINGIGWNGFFAIMVVLAGIGIFLNISARQYALRHSSQND